MELWIRTQNKGALIKVEMLGNTDGTIKSYLGVNQTVLGTYKSSERALEVLDEIQNILKPQIILSKVGKPLVETCDGTIYREHDEYDIKEMSTYVYEMPEE